MNNATTMSTAASNEPVTAEDILAAVKRSLNSLPVDPLEQWMVAQGFDPARGGVLYLPLTMRAEFLGPPPDYVRFTGVLNQPMLARDIMRLPWSMV